MSASSAPRTGVGRTTGSVMDEIPGRDDLRATDNNPATDNNRGVDNNPAEPEYTANGLPSGLSISAAGVISGTVTSLGTHTVTITATDPARDPHSVIFDWIVL